MMGMESMSVETEVRRRSMLPVLFAGGITTALALVGNVVLANVSDGEFDMMATYANLIIPIGPLVVGFVAGIGYGLASWLTGVKITGRLLWIVVFCQLLAYLLAQGLSILPMVRFYQQAGAVGDSFGDLLRALVRCSTRSPARSRWSTRARSYPAGGWGRGATASAASKSLVSSAAE